MRRCFYQSGTYDKLESYATLDATLTKLEAGLLCTPQPMSRIVPSVSRLPAAAHLQPMRHAHMRIAGGKAWPRNPPHAGGLQGRPHLLPVDPALHFRARRTELRPRRLQQVRCVATPPPHVLPPTARELV